MTLLENVIIKYNSVLPESTIPAAINPNICYQEAYQKFSVQSIVAMELILVLAILFTYFVTDYILKPLKELTQSVPAFR